MQIYLYCIQLDSVVTRCMVKTHPAVHCQCNVYLFIYGIGIDLSNLKYINSDGYSFYYPSSVTLKSMFGSLLSGFRYY